MFQDQTDDVRIGRRKEISFSLICFDFNTQPTKMPTSKVKMPNQLQNMYLSFPNFYSTWRTWPILGQGMAYGTLYLGSSFQISVKAIKLSKPLRFYSGFSGWGHPSLAVIFILNFLQRVLFQKWVRARSWDILSSCMNYKNRKKQDGCLHQGQVLCWMMKPHNSQETGGCHNKI